MSGLHSALDFPLSGYRKLWAFPPAYSQAPPEHNRQSSSYKSEFTLGSDLLVVLAAFFCALICAPGLNALLKWALRCSRRRVSNSSDYEVDISLGNAGLKEEAMTALPVIICTATSNPPAMSVDCPICLTEFTVGEKLRLIPQCSHGFHIECIDQWLLSHSSCPVCRRCLNLHSENKMSVGAVIDEVIESNSAMHIVID